MRFPNRSQREKKFPNKKLYQHSQLRCLQHEKLRNDDDEPIKDRRRETRETEKEKRPLHFSTTRNHSCRQKSTAPPLILIIPYHQLNHKSYTINLHAINIYLTGSLTDQYTYPHFSSLFLL